MTKKTWRRVRVVVEVPVQGEYSEKDLAWDVQRSIDTTRLHRAMLLKTKTGWLTVKEFSRVMRQKRDDPAHVHVAEIRKKLTEISTRLSRLEAETSPHARAGYD